MSGADDAADRSGTRWAVSLAVLCSVVLWWFAQVRHGLVIRGDFAAIYHPALEFLHRSIWQRSIPGWMPWQFSGTPFIGDPVVPWAFLPDSLPYLVTSGPSAAQLTILLSLIIASVGMVLLGRRFGCDPAGAALAAIVFNAIWMLERSSCCPAYSGLGVAIPWLLLGAHIAATASSLRRYFTGVILGGFALAQAWAIFPGQGAMYAVLAMALCALIASLHGLKLAEIGRGVGRATVSVLGIGVLGAGFGAVWIIPGSHVNALSTAALGKYDVDFFARAYSRSAESWHELLRILMLPSSTASWWFVGAPALVLAVVALLLARQNRWTWFAVVLVAAPVIVIIYPNSPLMEAVNGVVPIWDLMHSHAPERVLLLVPIGMSLLAGIALTVLRNLELKRSQKFAALLSSTVIVTWVSREFTDVGTEGDPRTIWAFLGVVALGLLVVVQPKSAWAGWAAVVAIGVTITWDAAAPYLTGAYAEVGRTNTPLVSVEEYDDTTAISKWLQRNLLSGERFASYDPAIAERGDPTLGMYRRYREQSWPLLPENRATMLSLPTIQGYSPTRLRWYDSFINAMNGAPQEYHEAALLEDGVQSPLADRLALRYLVVPSDQRESSLALRGLPVVFEESGLSIVERPESRPGAWLASDTKVAPEGMPSELAEFAAPNLVYVLDPNAEAILGLDGTGLGTIEPERRAVNSMTFRVSADGSVALVISEVWAPGWRATVDGEDVPVLRVDGTLIGVPIQNGDHLVELRYAVPGLRIGLAISALSVVVAAAALILARHRSPDATQIGP